MDEAKLDELILPNDNDLKDYTTDLPIRLAKAFQSVRENLDKAATRQKKHYDKYRTTYTYRVGDLVLRETNVLSDASKKFCAKLAPKREGPFEIAKMIPDNVALLKEPNSEVELGTVHICQLPAYHPPVMPDLPHIPPKTLKRGRPPGRKKYNLHNLGELIFSSLLILLFSCEVFTLKRKVVVNG